MKIYIMDTIELPKGSGGATHKWELAKNLSKMGHEVHVMTYEDTKVEGAVTHTMKAREKYRFDFLFKLTHLVSILRIYLIRIIYKECIFCITGTFNKEDWKSKNI